MGCVQVKPTLVHDYAVDQWYKYVSRSSLLLAPLMPPQGLDLTNTNPISRAKYASKSFLNNTR
jgi:hypothetical protein